MKKQITKVALAIVFACFFFKPDLKAQAFQEGQSSIAVGYGFPYLAGTIFNIYEIEPGYAKSGNFGPIYAKYEYGIAEHIGLGLNFAYAQAGASFTYASVDNNGADVNYTEKIKYSTMSFLARVNYHFGESDKFDPYVGVGLGYRTGNFTWSSNDPAFDASLFPNFSIPEPFGFELTAGARYFFTDNIGAYAEVGLAKSPVQVGLVVKFGGK